MTAEQVERRVAASLHAYADSIDLDPVQLTERLDAVRARGAGVCRRHRLTVLSARLVAAAAAVLAVLSLAGGVPWQQDDVAPYADRDVAQLTEPFAVGEGTPVPGTRYAVRDFPLPFTFAVPAQGDVPGRWHWGSGNPFSIGLDVSPSTGFASVALSEPEQVYAPDRPWTEQDSLVPAPQDADGWQQWLDDTGLVRVVERTDIDVAGVPATRLTVEVSDELPDSYVGCAPAAPCLATMPIGPGTVGSGFQAGLFEGSTAELTVLRIGSRTLLATAAGADDTSDQWLPLMRSIVDSFRFT